MTMLGVILWNDPETDRAVIWCEDQGQLAFYRPDLSKPKLSDELTVGDLVQFDLRQDETLRYAHNVHLVAGNHYKDIADNLVSNASQATYSVQRKPAPRNIIEFRKTKTTAHGYAVA